MLIRRKGPVTLLRKLSFPYSLGVFFFLLSRSFLFLTLSEFSFSYSLEVFFFLLSRSFLFLTLSEFSFSFTKSSFFSKNLILIFEFFLESRKVSFSILFRGSNQEKEARSFVSYLQKSGEICTKSTLRNGSCNESESHYGLV